MAGQPTPSYYTPPRETRVYVIALLRETNGFHKPIKPYFLARYVAGGFWLTTNPIARN